jgi:hypothetical protein
LNSGLFVSSVIPAKVGIQGSGKVPNMWPLDSGFRRNDGKNLGLRWRRIDYLKGSFPAKGAR